MTDGYGDYVRHFLRSMSFYPILTPDTENHLLTSSSVIQLMEYSPMINKFLVVEVPADKLDKTLIHYRTFDLKSVEKIRMTKKPNSVLVNQTPIRETNQPNEEGWSWSPLEKGGILTISHQNGNRITVMGN
jgi:hypothetical protein